MYDVVRQIARTLYVWYTGNRRAMSYVLTTSYNIDVLCCIMWVRYRITQGTHIIYDIVCPEKLSFVQSILHWRAVLYTTSYVPFLDVLYRTSYIRYHMSTYDVVVNIDIIYILSLWYRIRYRILYVEYLRTGYWQMQYRIWNRRTKVVHVYRISDTALYVWGMITMITYVRHTTSSTILPLRTNRQMQSLIKTG